MAVERCDQAITAQDTAAAPSPKGSPAMGRSDDNSDHASRWKPGRSGLSGRDLRARAHRVVRMDVSPTPYF
jgi:hypothetical protein